MKPGGFSLSMNQRFNSDIKSLLQWLMIDSLPNMHFAMWIHREIFERADTYEVFRQTCKTFQGGPRLSQYRSTDCFLLLHSWGQQAGYFFHLPDGHQDKER